MRVLSARLFAFAFLCASFSFAANRLVAAEGDPAVMQADRAFVQAAAKGDAAALGKMVDAEFTWTDVEGRENADGGGSFAGCAEGCAGGREWR